MLRKILNLFSKKETSVVIEPIEPTVAPVPEPAPEPVPVPVVTEIKITDTVATPSKTAVMKTTNRSGRPKK